MTETQRSIRGHWPGLTALVVLLMAVGLVSRIAPLLNQGNRLLWQFPTEDGYLMLTIARNMAIGNGMSTAAGTIPTNGTQPLCTFVWAACFAAAGGDRAVGVAFVQIVEILIGLCSALVIYRLIRTCFQSSPRAPALAALSAAVWYASPLSVGHTQNCLETGAYALVVALVALAFVTSWRDPVRPWSAVRIGSMGLLLGTAFWVRNDAVWLIAAACLIHVGYGWRSGPAWLRRRFIEAFVMGMISVIVAVPWLVYNKTHFGSIMPISGISESFTAKWGGNLSTVPAALAEYVLAIFPIPSHLEHNPAVMAVCIAFIAAMLVLTGRAWQRGDDRLRMLIVLAGLYGLALCSFYGVYFGAAWFLTRYFFPLFGFIVVVPIAVLLGIWQIAGLRDRRVAWLCPAAVLVVVAALNVRIYANGSVHPHAQAVQYARDNVPEATWIAASQTGTLGFFHDRTLNLDGKVNPEALRARLSPGVPNGIPQYIVDKNVQYIVDWIGFAGWKKFPALDPHFDVIVEDKGRNLAVLKRRDTKPVADSGVSDGSTTQRFGMAADNTSSARP